MFTWEEAPQNNIKVYIKSHVILYGCETRLLILREDCKMRIFFGNKLQEECI